MKEISLSRKSSLDFIVKVIPILAHERISVNKRTKIILTSIILSIGLLSSQAVPFYLTYRFIIGLGVLAYLLSLWSLWVGINRLKAVVLLILPTLFTLAVASYYFLLPAGWGSRLPTAIFFGLIFYGLLLSQNVFNVSSIRTIPLYRVASTIVFILTLITAYLLYNVILSFNLLFVWNGIAILALSFPLILQMIWSIEMEEVGQLVIFYSLALSLIMGEIGLVFSFWPISKSMGSLSLATAMYVVLGITTHSMRDRLSRGVVWEYLGWGAAIFLIAFLSTSWVG